MHHHGRSGRKGKAADLSAALRWIYCPFVIAMPRVKPQCLKRSAVPDSIYPERSFQAKRIKGVVFFKVKCEKAVAGLLCQIS